ncbi:MAG: hypothetical protein JW869_00330 [Candidatus Omnitrophica bacterium]|nr:hypothetical protein [Candidatus Omnitrophota bacterium]
MRKRKFLLVFALGLVLTVVSASTVFASEENRGIVYKFWKKILPFDDRLELGGFLKNETSVRMAHGFDEFMKVKNIAGLKVNYRITDWWEMFTYFNWFWDGAYSIEDDRYGNVSFEDVNRKLRMPEKLQWLREAYFDFYFDKLDARIGKQQVVWGTTDGVRILDLVNPLDYREWTIKDYADIRIPLFMGNFEGELLMDGHLQVLVIPDYEPNYYAPAGAPFTLRTVDIGAQGTANAVNQGVSVQTIDEKPGRQFKNTKVGARWQHVLGGWDYTLNYLHTYDFASSAYTAFIFRPFAQPVLQLVRRAEQIDVFGGSFSKTLTEGFWLPFLKGWTLRGEYAYIKGGAMNYGYDKEIQGTVDVDQYNYALGFDRYFWTNWLFSYQFIQLIADPQEEYPGFYTNVFGIPTATENTLLFGPTRGGLDETTTIMSLKISTDFIHERLKPEILVLYTFNGDWRVSPKVSFEINDRWTIAGGAHVFTGDEQGLNGQFDKNDQVFFETTYNW